LEAVQKAESIKPDIVLLDVGLPKLNGLNTAELIRKCSPESKIVFLTNETDPDVVKAALDTGALGYVHKLQAGTELKTAVEAALRGQQFVSPNLKVDFLDIFAAWEHPPKRCQRVCEICVMRSKSASGSSLWEASPLNRSTGSSSTPNDADGAVRQPYAGLQERLLCIFLD
jgi:DNA-binding NarL/FixJ family response regulator